MCDIVLPWNIVWTEVYFAPTAEEIREGGMAEEMSPYYSSYLILSYFKVLRTIDLF